MKRTMNMKRADELLRPVFGGAASIDMMALAKHVSAHVTAVGG